MDMHAAHRRPGTARPGFLIAVLLVAGGVGLAFVFAGLPITRKARPRPTFTYHLALNDALIEAARERDVAAVRGLLDLGASPDPTEGDSITAHVLEYDALTGRTRRPHWSLYGPSHTALMAAAATGSPPVARLLLDAGANVNARDERGRSPLSYAVSNRCLGTARLLLDRGARAESHEEQGESPLTSAVVQDSVPRVVLLLRRGAAVDGQARIKGWRGPEWSDTPLMCAANYGRMECMRLLLAAGADVNRRGFGGETGCMRAARQGHVDCLERLVARGADLNVQSTEGGTALCEAVTTGRPQIVEWLADRGGDVNHRLRSFGREGSLLSIAASGHDLLCLEALLRKGADVNLRTAEGRTALTQTLEFAYSEQDPTDAVRVLLSHGAKVNEVDGQGWTALHWAAICQRIGPVETLIEAGADVNAQHGREWTVLTTAAANGHAETVKLLLSHGARVNARNGDGTTALGAVLHSPDGVPIPWAVVRLLRRAGGKV